MCKEFKTEELEIHKRRDQLIQALCGLQATVWIGLFSVGFWNPSSCWKIAFWIAMFFNTIAMIWQFFVFISCYYYFQASDRAQYFRNAGDPIGLKQEQEKMNFWMPIWNSCWYAFSIGITLSIISVVFRFLG